MGEPLTGFDKLQRRLMRRFREDFPTLYPVKVRVTKMDEGEYGDTSLVVGKKESYILVRVNREESDAAKFLTLLHELGHALDWGTPSQEAAKDDRYPRGHGPSFGVAYADLWERLIGSVGE